MKVLVTAGGTSEQIDRVRTITNMSTGRLGSAIADAIMDKGVQVTYVCGKNAVHPARTVSGLLHVDSVDKLQHTLADLLEYQRFDAIVHAMAVSDYGLEGTCTADTLAKAIADGIIRGRDQITTQKALEEAVHQTILQSISHSQEKKMSSQLDNLLLFMTRTPKIISIFKKMQPNALLVGFKLLVGAGEEALLDAADQLMARNQCDFVVANDLEQVSGDRHEAYLLGQNKQILARMGFKQEIAQAIVDHVLAKWEAEQG